MTQPKKDFKHFLENPKNFAEFQPENEPVSQVNYPEPSYTSRFSIDLAVKMFLSTGILSLVTAPLTTSYISLQLSSKKTSFSLTFSHEKTIIKETLSRMQIKTPEIARKYALLLENSLKNSKTLPFKPVQYASYSEVFRGLNDQGFLGLYKGNFLGVLYIWLNTLLKLQGGMLIEERGWKYKELAMFGLYTAIDMCLHPLQTLQTRFILQNRNKKLALYTSVADAVKKMRFQAFFQGVLVHFPRNLIIISFMNLQNSKQLQGNEAQKFIACTLLSNALTYPLMTVMRRMMCQENNVPFMLERKYQGFIHGLITIQREEGWLRGLWKGFAGFFVVSTFMMALNFTRIDSNKEEF